MNSQQEQALLNVLTGLVAADLVRSQKVFERLQDIFSTASPEERSLLDQLNVSRSNPCKNSVPARRRKSSSRITAEPRKWSTIAKRGFRVRTGSVPSHTATTPTTGLLQLTAVTDLSQPASTATTRLQNGDPLLEEQSSTGIRDIHDCGSRLMSPDHPLAILSSEFDDRQTKVYQSLRSAQMLEMSSIKKLWSHCAASRDNVEQTGRSIKSVMRILLQTEASLVIAACRERILLIVLAWTFEKEQTFYQRPPGISTKLKIPTLVLDGLSTDLNIPRGSVNFRINRGKKYCQYIRDGAGLQLLLYGRITSKTLVEKLSNDEISSVAQLLKEQAVRGGDENVQKDIKSCVLNTLKECLILCNWKSDYTTKDALDIVQWLTNPPASNKRNCENIEIPTRQLKRVALEELPDSTTDTITSLIIPEEFPPGTDHEIERTNAMQSRRVTGSSRDLIDGYDIQEQDTQSLTSITLPTAHLPSHGPEIISAATSTNITVLDDDDEIHLPGQNRVSRTILTPAADTPLSFRQALDESTLRPSKSGASFLPIPDGQRMTEETVLKNTVRIATQQGNHVSTFGTIARLATVDRLESTLGTCLFKGMNESRMREREKNKGLRSSTDTVRLHVAYNSGDDFKLEIWLCSSVGKAISNAKLASSEDLQGLLGHYLFEAMKTSNRGKGEGGMGASDSPGAIEIAFCNNDDGSDCKLEVALNHGIGMRVFYQLYPIVVT